MRKLNYVNPLDFKQEVVEFEENHIQIAEYVEKAVHLENFIVEGPIISDDKKKLVIGVLNNNREIGEPITEKYKITIEKF